MELPPIREARKVGDGNSSVAIPKQIFLNFTGKLDMSISPRHIRVPRSRKDSELRQSTKSQLAKINEKKSKNIKLFSLALDKDYFNRKIKKTVRHYFQARRTSMGQDFNDIDFPKDKKTFQETLKNDHKITIELNPPHNLTEKLPNTKALSSRLPSQTFPLASPSPANFLQTPSKYTPRNKNQKTPQLDLHKPPSSTVDQGLQTEDLCTTDPNSHPSELSPFINLPNLN